MCACMCEEGNVEANGVRYKILVKPIINFMFMFMFHVYLTYMYKVKQAVMD